MPNTNNTGMVANYKDALNRAFPVVKLLVPMGEFPENLIRYGDQVQLDGQGPFYTICWDNGDGLYSGPPQDGGRLIVAKNADGAPPGPPAPLTNSGKQWPQEYNFPDQTPNNSKKECICCLTARRPASLIHRTTRGSTIIA